MVLRKKVTKARLKKRAFPFCNCYFKSNSSKSLFASANRRSFSPKPPLNNIIQISIITIILSGGMRRNGRIGAVFTPKTL